MWIQTLLVFMGQLKNGGSCSKQACNAATFISAPNRGEAAKQHLPNRLTLKDAHHALNPKPLTLLQVTTLNPKP